MLTRLSTTTVLLAGLATTVIIASPALRTHALQQWASVGDWTEEARRADPVGFAEHAKQKLQQDLVAMHKTRQELAVEVGQIARKVREQEAYANQAQSLAESFRAQHQLASIGNGFPIEVRGAAYTQDQTRAQVSMLLAQSDGYRQSLNDLLQVKRQAEMQMESLTVKVSTTESQLAALSAKRELLRARQLTAEGEQLLAQVDVLMTGNARLIAGNPVRTVQELLNSPASKPGMPASNSRVQAFLSGRLGVEQVDTTTIPNEIAVQNIEPLTAQPTVAEMKPAKPSKPIFQQF